MSKETKTIEVTSCYGCPFKSHHQFGRDYCKMKTNVNMDYFKVPKDCPLKKQSITVKIK